MAGLAAVVGLQSTAGRVLAFAGALSVSLAGVVRSRMSPEAVRDWTRARSVAEAVKSEVYLYVTAVGDYRDDVRDERLSARVEELERDAHDLLRHTAGIEPKRRSVPAVRDVLTYISG